MSLGVGRERRRQRGQAAVFVVVMLAVVLISLNFLYKAGKLTSERIELQNAADATAYSISLLEARDLNFAAYINRAMVANEVAIGQMVGLVSWAYHWKSFGAYLRAYDSLFLGPATLGVSTPIVTSATAAAFDTPGGIMISITTPVARIGSVVLHNINKVYGIAQQGFHWVNVLYAIATWPEMISQNAPGAKLSDYGWLAMIGHTATFGVIPGLPGAFVKTYRSRLGSAAPSTPPAGDPGGDGAPSDTENQEGMKRLAATIRESRDEFTKQRGWSLPFTLPPPLDILPLDVHETISFGFDFVVVSATVYITLDFEFGISLDRLGGSELRYFGSADGQRYGWSAADTTGIQVHFVFGMDIVVNACVLGICGDINVGGFNVSLSGGRAKLTVHVPDPIDEDWEVVNVPFPTSAPFASGSAQIGKPTPNSNLARSTADVALVGTDTYGRAPEIASAWSLGAPFVPTPLDTAPAPAVPVVSQTMPLAPFPTHTVSQSYRGLPMYLDTVPQTTPWGFEAPYLIVGLVKDEDKLNRNAEPSGSLSLHDAVADGEIGAIAKSEVYFKRPLDFDLFARADGLVEHGSAFNPYWNARLVDTTHADRVVSMAIQQKQLFAEADTIVDLVDDAIAAVTGFFSGLDPSDWLP